MRAARLVMVGLLAAACAVGNLAAAAESAAQQAVVNADRLWVAGKLDDAQKSFEAAVAADPTSVDTRLRLAGFQLSRQQTSACIANYQKVISAEPKNSRAWIGLGMAYLHSGRAPLARAAFEEAIRVDPARQEKLAPLIAKLDEKKA